MNRLASTLADLSAEEMVSAIGLGGAPRFVRAAGRSAFAFASRPLGRMLARFDERAEGEGIALAAAGALADLEATWETQGEVPESGPLLIVANHPGAYDALVLFAAMKRRDVAVVAADRPFLRALPSVARSLLFVPDGPGVTASAGASALRGALVHLRRGGALLHFAAGSIEPDPAFASVASALGVWHRGTGALVRGALRARGQVVTAIVSAVHSPRAKRFFVTRIAERHGVTTLAPLLQVALPAFRNVAARVRFSEPIDPRVLGGDDDAAITARVRDRALALLG